MAMSWRRKTVATTLALTLSNNHRETPRCHRSPLGNERTAVIRTSAPLCCMRSTSDEHAQQDSLVGRAATRCRCLASLLTTDRCQSLVYQLRPLGDAA